MSGSRRSIPECQRAPLRRALAAAALFLLLGVHLAAASVAADCAARCRHSCCRAALGGKSMLGGAHCSHAAKAATACALRGHCDHAQKFAITSIPPLALSLAPAVRPTETLTRITQDSQAVPRGQAPVLDPPPPRSA